MAKRQTRYSRTERDVALSHIHRMVEDLSEARAVEVWDFVSCQWQRQMSEQDEMSERFQRLAATQGQGQPTGQGRALDDHQGGHVERGAAGHGAARRSGPGRRRPRRASQGAPSTEKQDEKARPRRP